MNREYLEILFKRHSSGSDEELMPLIDEYISTGRRRKILLKSAILIFLVSIAIGSLTRIMNFFLNFERDLFFFSIGGGFMGALSVVVLTFAVRRDIKNFLKSKQNNMI